MKKIKIAFSFLMGFLMIGEGAFLWADAPQFINYQGKLTTPQGSPIETQVTIDFRFYNGAGTLLNGATPASVDVTPIKGVFSVLVPVEAQWFLNPEVYVGITVDGGPEMSPRQRLVSAPYALGVSNGSVTGGANGPIADSTITNDDIATNAGISKSKLNLTGQIDDADINASAGISKSKINFGTGLTSAEIANGAVTNEKIASGIDATKLTGLVPDASLPATIDASKLNGDLPAINGAALTGVVAASISDEAAAAFVTREMSEKNYIQPVYITNDGRFVLERTYDTSICRVDFTNQQVFYFDCNNDCNQGSVRNCSTTRVEGYIFKR